MHEAVVEFVESFRIKCGFISVKSLSLSNRNFSILQFQSYYGRLIKLFISKCLFIYTSAIKLAYIVGVFNWVELMEAYMLLAASTTFYDFHFPLFFYFEKENSRKGHDNGVLNFCELARSCRVKLRTF